MSEKITPIKSIFPNYCGMPLGFDKNGNLVYVNLPGGSYLSAALHGTKYDWTEIDKKIALKFQAPQINAQVEKEITTHQNTKKVVKNITIQRKTETRHPIRYNASHDVDVDVKHTTSTKPTPSSFNDKKHKQRTSKKQHRKIYSEERSKKYANFYERIHNSEDISDIYFSSYRYNYHDSDDDGDDDYRGLEKYFSMHRKNRENNKIGSFGGSDFYSDSEKEDRNRFFYGYYIDSDDEKEDYDFDTTKKRHDFSKYFDD